MESFMTEDQLKNLVDDFEDITNRRMQQLDIIFEKYTTILIQALYSLNKGLLDGTSQTESGLRKK